MPIYTPAPRHALPGPTITPWSKECNPVVVNAPSSATWTANKAWFWPMTVLDPFTVQKVFWANGATVGTDSIDMAVYEMTDLTTGRCDMIRGIGGTLSAGANACQEVGSWRTAKTRIELGSSSTDAQTYTTASVTLKAGRLYCFNIENSHGSSATAVSSIDNSGTWTSRATLQFNSSLNRVSLWTFVPTTDYTGTLVINFGATTQTGCCWNIIEISGVDTSTNDGIVQTATNSANSSTAPSVTLSSFGSTNNATLGSFAQGGTTIVLQAGSGFTNIAEQSAATPAQILGTEWRVDSDTSVDGTYASPVNWGGIAYEVKADTSSFIIPAKANIYGAFVVSGGTATIIQSVPSATTTARQQGMLELTSAFPLSSTVTPVALTTIKVPLAGFSRRSLLA